MKRRALNCYLAPQLYPLISTREEFNQPPLPSSPAWLLLFSAATAATSENLHGSNLGYFELKLITSLSQQTGLASRHKATPSLLLVELPSLTCKSAGMYPLFDLPLYFHLQICKKECKSVLTGSLAFSKLGLSPNQGFLHLLEV